MVKSKYSYFQIIVYTLAAGFFCLAAYSILKNNPSTTKTSFGAVLICILGLSLPLNFFNNTPRIVFTDDLITIKKFFTVRSYDWNQVENVSLSAQENFSYLFVFGYNLNAMKLTFDDGKTLKAWTEKYSNIAELRGYVSRKLNEKFHFLRERKAITTNDVFTEKKYSGNSLTSFNTLLIVGMIIFFLIISNVEMKRKAPIIFPILIMSLLYIGFGIQMYFFEIKDQKLVVRNHYFPWIKKEYDLNNIEEVSKESPYRRSDGLRIITYEFKSRFYGAGSLRTHNWKELFEDLSSLGIKTNN